MINKQWIRLTLMTTALLALGACSQHEQELESLALDKLALEERLSTEREMVQAMLLEMDAVQSGMRELAERQGALDDLTLDDAELARSPQQRVMDDIALIDELLESNRTRIDALEKKVRSGEGKVYEFERVVANLKLDIVEKEKSILGFKERLVDMEDSYARLLDDYHEQQLISAMQEDEMHKVYFAYGTQDELIEEGVIEKKGGVLGIGKVKQLKSDFNRAYFTEVDMRDLSDIPLSVESAELLTQHPEETYQIIETDEEGVDRLVITDPEGFWSSSKYMAMVVK